MVTGHSDNMHIVAMRPGALGDALLTLPVLALIRQSLPGARVTLVSRGDVLPIALASGLANTGERFDAPQWLQLFAEMPPQTPQAPQASALRSIIAGATVVAWMGDADGGIARNLAALGAAQVIIGPPRPPAGGEEHMALLLARALAPLGIAIPADARALAALLPPLAVPREAEDAAARALAPLAEAGGCWVAIHPGSGGMAKRWPPERFAALADWLHDHGYIPVVVTGAQDEVATAALLAATTTATPVRVVRGLSVAALVPLLRGATAYVGNDAGVTHLAGLVGVPTLALFGPTTPAQWSPLGPAVTCVRAPDASPDTSIESLSATAVIAALARLLG